MIFFEKKLFQDHIATCHQIVALLQASIEQPYDDQWQGLQGTVQSAPLNLKFFYQFNFKQSYFL